MSTKHDSVRISRKVLEKLKAAASFAISEEARMVRDAAHIVKDRERLKGWAGQTGKSALALRGESQEEIQAIQNRSGIRSAGVGALLAWLANTDAIKNWKTAKEHWWLLPLAVLALGWWLKNRGYKDAPAIMTFGGAMFVQAYQKNRDDEDAKKAAPAASPTANTAGFADTGALHLMGNHAWLQDAFGRWVKIAVPAGLPAALGAQEGNFRALPAPSNTNTAGPTQEDYEAAQQLAAAAFVA